MTIPADLSPLYISIATTCAATAATFFLGLVAARLMYGRGGNVRAWIDGILTLPLVLPPTVVGFFLLLVFGRRSPLGHALERIGFEVAFSWPATVIAATVVAFPLMYRTALGAFEQVNPNYLQAARTLGASEWVVFRAVLMPLAGPGVVAGTVLAFARAMGEFGATLMLAGNIPGRTQTMPIAIFSAVEGGHPTVAMLWVTLIVVLSLAIIRLLNIEKKKRIRPIRDTQRSSPEPSAICPSPRKGTVTGNATSARSTLTVDVSRKLDAFTLQAAFEVGEGTLGLLGPSGSGKSMTLRMIAGLLRPDRGRIVFNGKSLFDDSANTNVPAAVRKVGIVFQDYALFPHMTVAQNVGFGLRHYSSAERKARVASQLAQLHIADLAERFPGEISGGQRQRVAIARCLATEPDLLLLDEPFAALDPHLRRQTEEQLRATLAEYPGSVLFVTHDMEEAFRFCSDLLVLDEGAVIARGPRIEIFEKPGRVAVARLTGCKNIASARFIAPGRVAVEAWGCDLQTPTSITSEITHVGYRSHQFTLQGPEDAANTFLCWLVSTSEAPHEMTLYLKIGRMQNPGDTHQLQADIPKTDWHRLRNQPQPWRLTFEAERILLLRD